MRYSSAIITFILAVFCAGDVFSKTVCLDPSGFDPLLTDPLIIAGFGIEQTTGFAVYAISEPEALRLAAIGAMDEITDSKTQKWAGQVGASLSDEGVVGLFGFGQTEQWINGPAVFVVARDPATDGQGYFEFRNFYVIPAQVDGAVQVEWIIAQPMIARRYTSGWPDCGCGSINGIECGEGKPGPGGGGCLPDIGCVNFPHDPVALGELPGPALQSVPNTCTGGYDYVDTFGNQVRGMLAFDQWYARALNQNFMGQIGGDFGLCELCKKVLPEACGDSPYSSPINLPPPVPECGAVKTNVDRICQVSLVEPSSGFCSVVPQVPYSLGPYCMDGSAPGALLSSTLGLVQTHVGEPRDCPVPTSDFCQRVEGTQSEYCDPGAEAARVLFWSKLLRCGRGEAPGAEFECLGTKGVCQNTGGVKFCSYCTGERCTQWVERGIGDPRRFQSSEEEQCDELSSSCSKPLLSLSIFGLNIELGGRSAISISVAPEEQKVAAASPEPSTDPSPKGGEIGAAQATQIAAQAITSGAVIGAEQHTMAADPVVVQTGELIMDPVDISLEGPVLPFEFTRSYSSRSDFRGVLGSNWTHNYETRLEFVRPGLAPGWTSLYCSDYWPVVTCLIRHHQHSTQLYILDPISKRFVPHMGSATSHIVDKGEHGFVLYEREGGRETFNSNGYLTSRQDRFGNGFDVELEYTPLGYLQRRYCARTQTIDARNDFQLNPLVCAYLGFALKDQPAELLARTGWTAPGSALLPPDLISDVKKSWEYISHSPNPPPPFVYVEAAAYSQSITRANYFLQHLLGLGYMVEPASGSAHFRVKKVTERRHNRAMSFEYYDEAVDPATTQHQRFGLLKKVSVSNSGQRVEFEYNKPNFGAGFNEFFLTRARKLYTNLGAAYTDNTQLIAHSQNQQFMELVYTYYTGAHLWTEYYQPFFEHFEKTAGCTVVDEVACGYLKSQTDGNPCHLSELERLKYLSRISDNIVKVERAGVIELESTYGISLHGEHFDRVVSQNYGGRLDGEFSLSYVSAGPMFFSAGATPMGERVQNTGVIHADLLQMYPLEVSPIELHDKWNTVFPGCASGPGQGSNPMCATYDPPREPGEDVNDSSGSCGAGFVHNVTGANSLRCRWDGSHLGLPGFKPTFDYFPAPAGDGPSRTYMTCDQLATQHLYEVQSSGSVGSTYWDQDGKRWAQWVHNRDAIEQDLRRICSWAKTVNREGVEQYFGLNFRAQSLVEATHLASNEWHIVERIYNADGKLTKEWDARESASSSVRLRAGTSCRNLEMGSYASRPRS